MNQKQSTLTNIQLENRGLSPVIRIHYLVSSWLVKIKSLRPFLSY